MANDRIFINYRRSDSRGDSGRLYDRLAARFPGKVFRDVASLEPGMEWKDAISQVLGQTGACIVVIGKDWINITDASGHRRLDDPKDTVRQELANALERKMRVFPVLVGGAEMPREEELPPELQPLCRRNALEITEQDWDEGFNKLVKALEAALGLHQPPVHAEQASSRRKTWMFAAAGTVAALLLLVLYAASRDSSSSPTNEPRPPTQPSGSSSGSSAVGDTRNSDPPRVDTVSQLVGSWKANVVELGLPVEIIWHVWPNGTSSYTFTSARGIAAADTTWTYSDGVIYERSPSGPPSSASIRWIDRNHFVLTVLDNGNPQTRGLQRHYARLGP